MKSARCCINTRSFALELHKVGTEIRISAFNNGRVRIYLVPRGYVLVDNIPDGHYRGYVGEEAFVFYPAKENEVIYDNSLIVDCEFDFTVKNGMILSSNVLYIMKKHKVVNGICSTYSDGEEYLIKN